MYGEDYARYLQEVDMKHRAQVPHRYETEDIRYRTSDPGFLARKRAAEKIIASGAMSRSDFDLTWWPIPAYRAKNEDDDPRSEVPIVKTGKPKATFVTRDSGKQAEYGDGVKRDTQEGKPRFDLMFPEDVPYEDQLLTRVAELYERGGHKYGDRNWENSRTEESLNHHRAAFLRHAIKFYLGVEDGEDHAAATVWNVNAIDLTRRNIRSNQEAE